MQRDVVAERCHPHRVVTDALQRKAEGRAYEVADEPIDSKRHTQHHVIELVRVVQDVADEAWHVPVDAGDRREAAELGHLAEEVVRDHTAGEGQHQKVDSRAAGGDGAEQKSDRSRDRDCHHERDGRVPCERQALGLALQPPLADEVAEDVPGDAHQRRLGEREHPAVGGEEDQARRRNPEDEGLGEDRLDPVRVEDRRRRRQDAENREADDELERGPRRTAPEEAINTCGGQPGAPHSSLPKSPCGLNASTSAISAKVSVIEYCEQQLPPEMGR